MKQKTFFSLAVLVILALGLLSWQLVSLNKEMITIEGGVLETTDPITKESKIVEIKSFLLDKNLATV